MGFGSSSTKEPNDFSDIELMSLDQMRGAMKDLKESKLSLAEKGTVAGVITELNVVRQQLEMTHEQLRRLIGMYQTLQGEFDVYKKQRIAELQMKVNNGSTTFEDD